jgi:hypothetical protein
MLRRQPSRTITAQSTPAATTTTTTTATITTTAAAAVAAPFNPPSLLFSALRMTVQASNLYDAFKALSRSTDARDFDVEASRESQAMVSGAAGVSDSVITASTAVANSTTMSTSTAQTAHGLYIICIVCHVSLAYRGSSSCSLSAIHDV